VCDHESTWCIVTEKRINPVDVFELASDFGHGAQNFFFGAVRSKNLGRTVVAVGYDAFTPLAEATLYEIANEAKAKWGSTLKICIIHRIGKLEVGELSVAVGVAHPIGMSRIRYRATLLSKSNCAHPFGKKNSMTTGKQNG